MAATLQVGPDQYYKTIQSAINASNDGDTIYVDSGLYPEYVTINKPITLIGLENSSGGKPLLAHTELVKPTMEIAAFGVVVDGFDLRGGDQPSTPYDNRSYNIAGMEIAGCGCTIRNVSTSGFAWGIALPYSDKDAMGVPPSADDAVIISRSNISSNRYGVFIEFRSNVSLCENDFRDNAIQVEVVMSHDIWIYRNNFYQTGWYEYLPIKTGRVKINSSAPVQYTFEGRRFTNYTGNYWANYTGCDNNGDGIGDIPYIVGVLHPGLANVSPVNITDDYPAIAPLAGYSIEQDGELSAAIATPKPDLYGGYPPSSLHVLHVGPGQIYSTIQRATNASADGDTIYVHGDVYPEAVVVDKQLTLIGVPNSSGDRPIICGWPSNTTPGMTIINDHVHVENFAFEGNGNYSDGMYVRGGLVETGGTGGPTSRVLNTSGIQGYHIIPGTDFTVRNVTYDGFYRGLVISEYENVTVTDSVFVNDSVGIALDYAKHVTLARNDVIDTHLGVMSSCSSYIEVYQNNFVNNDYKTIDRYPVAGDIKANTSTPMSYMFRSQPKVNFTGNYWSNYSGVDQNGDGIGDSMYLIEKTRSSIVHPEGGQEYCNYTDDYPAIGMWSFDNGTAIIGEPKPGTSITPTATVTPTATAVPAGSDRETLWAVTGLLAMAAACELGSLYRSPEKKK